MRRGYIGWSKAELPEAVFAARLQRLRAAMAPAGLDALLAYTNNTRTAAVSWATGFVPYWAEGLLVVPRVKDPLLTMAFSNRIVGWGKGVSCVARFEGGAKPGQAAGKYLAELGARNVGVVELETLRAAIAQDLAAAAPAVALSDAGDIFAGVRMEPDPAEIALAARAGAIAEEALAQVSGREATLGEAVAAVDHAARLAGAEEIYVAAAPDLARDQRFVRPEGTNVPAQRLALRATVAYKGSWVRMIRSFGAETNALDEAGARFAAAIARLPELGGFDGFPSWSIEGCRLAQPLEVLAGHAVASPRAIAPSSLVTAQAVIATGGGLIPLAAPVLVGGDGFPSSLLVAPNFA